MLPPPRPVWRGSFDKHPCPVCGGKVFDNRLSKRNPKAPDLKCAQCGHPQWIPRDTTT